MIIHRAIIAGLIVITLANDPAFAAQPERKSASIRYVDLDLSTPAGIRKLRHRVADALAAACGSVAGIGAKGSRSETEAVLACRAENQVIIDRRIAALTSANVQVADAR